MVKKGKESKIPRREDDSDIVDKLQKKLQTALAKKEKAVSNDQKLTAAALVEDAKAELKKVDHDTS